MIIATCGHDVTNEKDLGTLIAVAEYSREGTFAVGHPVVCEKCLKWYKKRNLILTEEQQERWMTHGEK